MFFFVQLISSIGQERGGGADDGWKEARYFQATEQAIGVHRRDSQIFPTLEPGHPSRRSNNEALGITSMATSQPHEAAEAST